MDAVVHVFFKGNLLCPLKVWVRTNNGPNTVSEEEIGECSFDDYRNIITTSFDGKANGVYCNEVDERNISYELQSSAIKIGRINNTGSVTGFYDPSQPWVSFWTQIWELRQEWRFKTGGGAQVGSVAVVPLSSRESFYITYKKAKGGSSEGGFIQINPVGSAITYQAWENNIIWTGIARENCFEGGPSYPACWQLGDHPAGCGQTTPYVPIVWQQFGGTREYGPCEVGTQEWASPCTSMLSFPRYTGSASNTPLPSVNTLAESELVVTIVSSGIPENIVASREEQTGVAAWRYDEPWFQLSPSEDGLFQKIDSYGNELGEASTFVYYSTLDSGFDSVYGSPGGDEFKNGSWVNVGVVND